MTSTPRPHERRAYLAHLDPAAARRGQRPDKEGADSVFERELPDADVVISQPFWPAYSTAERIAKAPNLKLAITAGIGSDHVDLAAAIERGITVAEVTYSNSISVSEHVVMMILSLVQLPPVAPVGARRRLEHRGHVHGGICSRCHPPVGCHPGSSRQWFRG